MFSSVCLIFSYLNIIKYDSNIFLTSPSPLYLVVLVVLTVVVVMIAVVPMIANVTSTVIVMVLCAWSTYAPKESMEDKPWPF